MDTPHEERTDNSDDRAIMEPLPELVARRIEDESREHAATQPGNLLEHYRRGRVEAEAQRISEEVTREAQERLRMSSPKVQGQLGNEQERQETGRAEAADSDTMLTVSFTGEETLPAPKLLRRLLVPLDGTPESERTLPYTSALARQLHAHLTLGHITPTTDANRLAQALHVAGSDRLAAQQAFEPRALPYLQDLRWRLSIPPEQVEAHHISAPSVPDGLLTLASVGDIDLVVVGLRSHPDTDHFRLGRVIDTLMRKSTTPVLVIPPHVTADSHIFTLHHILVPLDGSALAEEALAPLLGLLVQTQGSTGGPLAVTLVRVVENQSALQESANYLESLRSVLMRMPACAQVQLYAETIIGSAPGAIVGMLERGSRGRENDGLGINSAGPVDLLIMATHGRGGVGRLLLGSVTDYVLPRADIPVLLVHPAYLDM